MYWLHDLLSPHQHKCFVQESLCVLNINNNNIEDIRELSVLKELQHFSAAKNKLLNITVSFRLLENLFYLTLLSPAMK